MAGTKAGGKAAAETNKKKYGADFYARIGAAGGKLSHTGGFATEIRDANGNNGRDRARIAGVIGGKKSKRRKAC
jgi:uncharacterized protein